MFNFFRFQSEGRQAPPFAEIADDERLAGGRLIAGIDKRQSLYDEDTLGSVIAACSALALSDGVPNLVQPGKRSDVPDYLRDGTVENGLLSRAMARHVSMMANNPELADSLTKDCVTRVVNDVMLQAASQKICETLGDGGSKRDQLEDWARLAHDEARSDPAYAQCLRDMSQGRYDRIPVDEQEALVAHLNTAPASTRLEAAIEYHSAHGAQVRSRMGNAHERHTFCFNIGYEYSTIPPADIRLAMSRANDGEITGDRRQDQAIDTYVALRGGRIAGVSEDPTDAIALGRIISEARQLDAFNGNTLGLRALSDFRTMKAAQAVSEPDADTIARAKGRYDMLSNVGQYSINEAMAHDLPITPMEQLRAQSLFSARPAELQREDRAADRMAAMAMHAGFGR